MPAGEERIKFDYLFDAGDPENKEFWTRTGPLRSELVNTFVRLEDDQVVFRASSPKQEISRVEEKRTRRNHPMEKIVSQSYLFQTLVLIRKMNILQTA